MRYALLTWLVFLAVLVAVVDGAGATVTAVPAARQTAPITLGDGVGGALRHTFSALNPRNSGAGGDNFAIDLALENGQLIVGAPRDERAGTRSGAIYLYDVAGDAVTERVVRTNPQGSNSDEQFGRAVAIADGRAFAGVIGDGPVGGANSGSFFDFDISNSSFADQDSTGSPFATGLGLSPEFGLDIAGFGDRIAVGARHADAGGAIDAGAAVLYEGPSRDMTILSNPEPQDNDRFASSIGISKDFVVFGAAADDTGAIADAGAVYAYVGDADPDGVLGVAAKAGRALVDLDNSGSNDGYRLIGPAPDAGDGFGGAAASGIAVRGGYALIGAADGDAVGSDGTETGDDDRGAAYLYDLSAGALEVAVSNPNSAPGGGFGASVALSESYMLITDSAGPQEMAYLYDRQGRLLASIANPLGSLDVGFGTSLALTDDVAIIGAPFADQNGADSGAFFVFAIDDLVGAPVPAPAPLLPTLLGLAALALMRRRAPGWPAGRC